MGSGTHGSSGLRGTLAALAVGLAACGGATSATGADAVDDPEPGRPHLVATTSILGDIVQELAEGRADVTVLMPPGTDPHAYAPSARDARLLREADLVVANGLGLEEGLQSMIDAAAAEGVRVLTVADQLDPIDVGEAGETGGGHEDGGHEDEDEHEGPDPHVWFDPVRMAEGVQLIAEAIVGLDVVTDDDAWAARADVYTAELLEVHDRLAAMFATIPTQARRLVTNHDALAYLAHRYDLEILGTIVPGSSTQAEADARGFAQLVETVEDAGVRAVFAEVMDSTALAEQLEAELVGRGGHEVRIVSLHTDAVGPPGSGAETYLGLLIDTGTRITEALGGSVPAGAS